MADRIYSEKEAADIVRRAVALSEQSLTENTGYVPGVTADELRRIAGEVGISSKYLEQALAEAHQNPSKRGPFNLFAEYEAVVNGELPMGDFDVVLENLKPMRGAQSVSQVGRTLTANAWTAPTSSQVQVSSRNGRTRINVRSSPAFAYILGMHAPLVAGIVGMSGLVASGHPLQGAALFAGLVLAGSVAFRLLVEAGKRSAERLANRLREAVSEATVLDATQKLAEAPNVNQNEQQEQKLGQE